MADMLRVGIADYKVGKAPQQIISYGLGSCIGISLYDPQTKVGGLVHIMLPDSTQARAHENHAKFADTGVPLLLGEVLKLGAAKSRLVAKIAGQDDRPRRKDYLAGDGLCLRLEQRLSRASLQPSSPF